MKNILFTLFILLFSTQILVAQNLKRANHLFEKRDYIAAAELLLNEDVKSKDIQQKLGDCYYFNSKMKEASTWYKKLVNNTKNTIEPTYFYRYSQALKGINEFNEADKWLQKYNEKKQLNSTTDNETFCFLNH